MPPRRKRSAGQICRAVTRRDASQTGTNALCVPLYGGPSEGRNAHNYFFFRHLSDNLRRLVVRRRRELGFEVETNKGTKADGAHVVGGSTAQAGCELREAESLFGRDR
jgi:hypothetical protein